LRSGAWPVDASFLVVLLAIPAVLCAVSLDRPRLFCIMARCRSFFVIPTWFELACWLRLGLLRHCFLAVLPAIPTVLFATLCDWPGLLCIMARYRSRFLIPSRFGLACCLMLGMLMHCFLAASLATAAVLFATLCDWPGLLCIMARYRSRFVLQPPLGLSLLVVWSWAC
jgi:hypothetical protein